MAWQHSQAHFARATLEGVTLNLNQIRLILDQQISPTRVIHANGGFTRSDFWVQLIADIFGISVKINETNESGCVGAILLAMKALGEITSLEAGVEKHVKFGKTYEPKAANSDSYKNLSKEFGRLMKR